MAEVIRVIEDPGVKAVAVAQVCGRRAGTIWEGWIEFQTDDGAWRRSPRETTQPDREALAYWAGGISPTYLEGALARALTPAPVATRVAAAEPQFDEPAPAVAPPPIVTERAVLDPYSVAAKGESLLRQELGALRAWHLRNIVRAYDLAEPSLDLESLTAPELIELIVTAVLPE
jgi:hypothetical protein